MVVRTAPYCRLMVGVAVWCDVNVVRRLVIMRSLPASDLPPIVQAPSKK